MNAQTRDAESLLLYPVRIPGPYRAHPRSYPAVRTRHTRLSRAQVSSISFSALWLLPMIFFGDFVSTFGIDTGVSRGGAFARDVLRLSLRVWEALMHPVRRNES